MKSCPLFHLLVAYKPLLIWFCVSNQFKLIMIMSLWCVVSFSDFPIKRKSKQTWKLSCKRVHYAFPSLNPSPNSFHHIPFSFHMRYQTLRYVFMCLIQHECGVAKAIDQRCSVWSELRGHQVQSRWWSFLVGNSTKLHITFDREIERVCVCVIVRRVVSQSFRAVYTSLNRSI